MTKYKAGAITEKNYKSVLKWMKSLPKPEISGVLLTKKQFKEIKKIAKSVL